MQGEIIQSVLQGVDTLALLPTGGGKSVCFQVPGLCLNKLTLVISPLIALMKDQVDQLNRRGVSAGMLASSMHRDESDKTIEQALNGSLQFLYVSPERLESENFRNLLPKLKPGLLAIDEAHCISQWGYDFRPSYLKIIEIRELIGNVPVIALTATATEEVVVDICNKLGFTQKQIFRKSFLRPNLAYIVRNTEDKHGQLLRILERVQGTSVVYVRNRKRCREIASFLDSRGISASYYHAGLDSATRALRQQHWIENKIRVIVCTNAFGMGIDKPDVRTVIHMDLPETPEAYFQEAGRAGRDEKQAWAILLNDPADEEEAMHRFERQWPGFDIVKAVYNRMGNFLQIPVGAGQGTSYPFQMSEFLLRFKIHPIECINALKFIESEGLISFTENLLTPSRLIFTASRDDVYDFELKHPSYEPLIKTILRSYGGAFSDFVQISENDLGNRIGLAPEATKKALLHLHKNGIISYHPSSDEPRIYFLEGRHHPERLPLSIKEYKERKQVAEKRFKAMLSYANGNTECRSKSLIQYFGEKSIPDCGMCDVCLEQKKKNKTGDSFTNHVFRMTILLKNGVLTLEEIIPQIPGDPELFMKNFRLMLDEGLIAMDDQGRLSFKSSGQ